MNTSPISFPKLTFTTRVYIWVFCLSVIFLLFAIAAWLEAANQTHLDAQRKVDQSLHGFDLLLDERSADLESTGNWLAGQDELANLLVSRDSTGLISYLEPLIKADIVDAITIGDNAGLVLARVDRDWTSTQGGNIQHQPGRRAAVEEQVATGVGRDRYGNLQQIVVLPVYDGEGNLPIGAIELAFYIDDHFLRRIQGQPSSGLTYFYADETILGEFVGREGASWPIEAVPSAVLTAGRGGRSTNSLILQTGRGPYLSKFKPFRSLDNTFVSMYGVGIPLTAMVGEPRGFFGRIALLSLAVAVLLNVGGYVFIHRYAATLRNLNKVAQGVANGDLSASIDLARTDYLGDLPKQLEQMWERLRGSLQTATQERDRYAAIIHSLGIAVAVTDNAHHIVALNPAAELLLRQSGTSLLGRDWTEVFGESGHSEEGTTLLWPSGESRAGRGPDLTIHGKVFLRRDPRVSLNIISRQFQMENSISGCVHALEDASTQEQFIRAKDEFIVNAAHEFRGPLAALRTSVEVLIDDQSTLSKQELNFMLRNMQRAVVRFQGFAENLIDMGNIIAGRFMVRPLPCRFREILELAIGQVKSQLEAREQTLDVRMHCPKDCGVFADRARIVQVLVNLIGNASKYGPDRESIVVSISADKRFMIVEITDRGPGVPPDEQDRLFQRFYRGKRAMFEGTGLGLGLALAKEIVEAHGGQIGLKSQMGAGTTLWFSLLLA